jgi:TonB family protein
LRAIHEYEADAAVLSQGINMRQYQYLLIQKAVSHCGYSVANGISHSTLKNRINMMLTNKKTNRTSWLKLLALVPIVGVALALNAESVNDYVYAEKAKTPQKKVVKKGRQDTKINMGTKTIEVKAEQEAEQSQKPATVVSPKIVIPETPSDHDPLLVLDGKIATREQVKALNQNEIGDMNVLKPGNEDLLKAYAKHYNADTSNGIIFIRTKAHIEEKKANPEKGPVVVVVAKKPEAEVAEKNNKGVVSMDSPEADEKAFDVVEQLPQYPGGVGEMMKFLSMNIKYPEAAEKAGTQGRVIASFIVEKDGTITNIKVVKKVSEELDAEAVRVINAMPKWTPGMQKGKAVRVKYTIPITFRLS